MIAAIGSGYQRMFIVPSMNLVVVRQGADTGRFSDATFLRLIFSEAEEYPAASLKPASIIRRGG